MFDSLKSVKRLEHAGVPREQAETHVGIMVELMTSNLVTQEQFKEGMASLESRLKEDIASLKIEMTDLRHQFDRLESRMTIKLGMMMFASMGLMAALLKVMMLK